MDATFTHKTFGTTNHGSQILLFHSINFNSPLMESGSFVWLFSALSKKQSEMRD